MTTNLDLRLILILSTHPSVDECDSHLDPLCVGRNVGEDEAVTLLLLGGGRM